MNNSILIEILEVFVPFACVFMNITLFQLINYSSSTISSRRIGIIGLPVAYSFQFEKPFKIIKIITNRNEKLDVFSSLILFLAFIFALLPFGLINFFEPIQLSADITIGSAISFEASAKIIVLSLAFSGLFLSLANSNFSYFSGEYTNSRDLFRALTSFSIIYLAVLGMEISYSTTDFSQISLLQANKIFLEIPYVGALKQPILFLAFCFELVTIHCSYFDEKRKFLIRDIPDRYGVSTRYEIARYVILKSSLLALIYVGVLFFLGGTNLLFPLHFVVEKFPSTLPFLQAVSILAKASILYLAIILLKICVFKKYSSKQINSTAIYISLIVVLNVFLNSLINLNEVHKW